MSLSFKDKIQNYFNESLFFRIFFIDTIDLRILLQVGGQLVWFSETDFCNGKLAR
jgi:hypothetical protein